MNIFKKIYMEILVFSSIIILVLGNLLTKFSCIDLVYLILVIIYFVRFLYIDLKGEKEDN